MTETTEAFARVKIDALLQDAGWNLTDGSSVLFEHAPPDGIRAADFNLSANRHRPQNRTKVEHRDLLEILHTLVKTQDNKNEPEDIASVSDIVKTLRGEQRIQRVYAPGLDEMVKVKKILEEGNQ